ncbi:MAG: hypothetical protein ACOH1Y_17920 [Propionicimonas sp.]
MTSAGRIPERARDDMSTGIAGLNQAGWTQADWDDLTDETTWGSSSSAAFQAVRYWLRHPPLEFWAPVTPAQVREMSGVYGEQVSLALDALAAGASERFVAAALANRHDLDTPTIVWDRAQDAHLSEPEAVGWAHTNHLNQLSRPQQTSIVETVLSSIPLWVARFGPTAYLWVLAGFTQAEAVAIRDSGVVVTDDQLRVMSALNGVTLPAGI